jgi:hypothetical protein
VIGTEDDSTPCVDARLPNQRDTATAASARTPSERETVSIAIPAALMHAANIASSSSFAESAPGPGEGCKSYFDAIAARDLESVLDAMTPDYGRHLRDLRRLPDFDAFFSVWCESQGRFLSVISSAVRRDGATVAFYTDKALVFAKLRRIGGRWLVDSEQVEQARKAMATRPRAREST